MYPTYHWVSRHTAQSWREHYKKNRAELDARIDEILVESESNPKAAHYRDRLWSKNSANDMDQDDEDELEEDETEEDGLPLGAEA